MVSIGEIDGFFSEVINAGFHEESIRMVADGRVDASAIDSQVLAIEMRDQPELSDRRKIIDSVGPSTIQPVAVSKRFDQRSRNTVRDVLIEFDKTPGGRDMLALGTVERWVGAEPADYDDIRRMVEACEAADFMEIR